MKFDKETKSFPIDVDALIYPSRLGEAYQDIVAARGGEPDRPDVFFKALVDRGFRAQLRSGNLITGQLYIALDFMKDAPKAEYDPSAKPVPIPSVPGSMQEIQDEIADIARKLDRIPFDKIGQDLHVTLTNASMLLAQLNTQVAPQAKATLQSAQGALDSLKATLEVDSPTQRNARQTMEELQRTARSLRTLADYLDRHPEALLRGKPTEAAPTEGQKDGAK
jgi:paraquat-inducible protein B